MSSLLCASCFVMGCKLFMYHPLREEISVVFILKKNLLTLKNQLRILTCSIILLLVKIVRPAGQGKWCPFELDAGLCPEEGNKAGEGSGE